MNTFPIMPPLSFRPRCQQCGAPLDLQRDKESVGVEVKPEDRMICPIHGDVMSVEEMRRMTVELRSRLFQRCFQEVSLPFARLIVVASAIPVQP